MTIIIISLAFTFVLTVVSLIFDVYLKLLEVTEYSNRIIIGLIETSTVRYMMPPEKTITFIPPSPGNLNQSTLPLQKTA